MSEWFNQFQSASSVAHSVLVLAIVAVAGLGLGSISARGIGLGVAGVLFAGLAVGHLGVTIDPTVLEFVRDFGLILFVYSVGLQVGPGFFNSLRRDGIRLNILAAAVVVSGALLALGIGMIAGWSTGLIAGIFAGATTNTPALGATLEAMKSVGTASADALALPSIGYAIAYPFGVVGIILAMLGLRIAFGINLRGEAQSFDGQERAEHEPVERINLRITNQNLDGLAVGDLPGVSELGVVVSRIKPSRADEVQVALNDTVVRRGDVVLAVGSRSRLEEFALIVGERTDEDLAHAPGRITSRRVVVTAHRVLGKSIRELGFDHRHGVTITRVDRGGIEFAAKGDVRLQFGDTLQIVGSHKAVAHVVSLIGNSQKALDHTNFAAIFVGIALGVLIGTYPVSVPGMPAPIRLGLAGGPLVVAILMSRIGRIGPLLSYMPSNANAALRQLGIILFLACVGIKAGTHFIEVLVHGSGLLWMGMGAIITIAPLLVVGFVARSFLKMNFISICGLLSGSMTDPPALAFANSAAHSDAPSVAYATVYPLSMILRIVLAQAIVLLFT